MSAANNIPFDIQVKIIKKVLPVKSLIRFRSVSKQWKALIDSSQFIMDHCVNPAQPHHLLVSYKAGDNEDHKFVSIVDDDSFPHHKFSPTVPPTVKLLRRVILVGCSHGLVCLSGFTPFRRRNRKELIVVWNPAIRKSVDIPLPVQNPAIRKSVDIHLPYELFVFGFGVCPKTSDIKIVKITLRRQETDPRSSVSQKAEPSLPWLLPRRFYRQGRLGGGAPSATALGPKG
ncbi:hypothetical protein SSX86_000654 [Deinandra increscens subsp. villosa]|uniref:F-box domain-containing protein n=1 Tax=Deinandra increscens subsp. villosa TaxID=3103831 RepID=A0AAP0DPU4_9ASTR